MANAAVTSRRVLRAHRRAAPSRALHRRAPASSSGGGGGGGGGKSRRFQLLHEESAASPWLPRGARAIAGVAAAAVVAGAAAVALSGGEEGGEKLPVAAAAAAAATRPLEAHRRAEAELLAACRQVIGEKETADFVGAGRVHSCHANTFAANDPIEDRRRVEYAPEDVPGALFAVFDGHGGTAAAQFCEDRLLGYVGRDFARRGGVGEVLAARPFLEADEDFLDAALAGPNPRDGLSGACVTVAHVQGARVRAANAGDCRAVVGRRSGAGWEAVHLTRDHELRHNEAERARLLREHPGEPDLLRRDRVKGHLQPTRGLGDGTYKRDEFFRMRPRYVRKHSTWTVPYTTAEPEITSYTLGKDDRFMVLATDGLFEDLSSEQVVRLVGQYCDAYQPAMARRPQPENLSPAAPVPANAATWLVEQALVAASRAAQVIPREVGDERHLAYILRDIPAGKRRKVHDDVTCVVVFFAEENAGVGGPGGQDNRVSAAAVAAATARS